MRRYNAREGKNRMFRRAAGISAAAAALVMAAVAAFITAGALPAISELGLPSLFKTRWSPHTGHYGVTAMLLSSAAASLSAALLALPFAVLGAGCYVNLLPPPLLGAIIRLCTLLCAIPAVLFGLIGLVVLIPAAQRAFPQLAAKSGGATLAMTIAVLSLMLLPSLLLDCITALKRSKAAVDAPSAALGATPMQTVFLLQLSQAAGGFGAAALNAVRRALCEAMAVLLVSGNVANMPALFKSARLLPSGMVLEMGYAGGLHRSALFFIGLVLLLLSLLFEGISHRGGDKR